jgi:hypothetical protein
MVLHPTHLVVVHFNKDSILKQTVLSISSLNLNTAVESANLRNFSRDQVTFLEKFTHVQLILIHSSALLSAGKINSS